MGVGQRHPQSLGWGWGKGINEGKFGTWVWEKSGDLARDLTEESSLRAQEPHELWAATCQPKSKKFPSHVHRTALIDPWLHFTPYELVIYPDRNNYPAIGLCCYLMTLYEIPITQGTYEQLAPSFWGSGIRIQVMSHIPYASFLIIWPKLRNLCPQGVPQSPPIGGAQEGRGKAFAQSPLRSEN